MENRFLAITFDWEVQMTWFFHCWASFWWNFSGGTLDHVVTQLGYGKMTQNAPKCPFWAICGHLVIFWTLNEKQNVGYGCPLKVLIKTSSAVKKLGHLNFSIQSYDHKLIFLHFLPFNSALLALVTLGHFEHLLQKNK